MAEYHTVHDVLRFNYKIKAASEDYLNPKYFVSKDIHQFPPNAFLHITNTSNKTICGVNVYVKRYDKDNRLIGDSPLKVAYVETLRPGDFISAKANTTMNFENRNLHHLKVSSYNYLVPEGYYVINIDKHTYEFHPNDQIVLKKDKFDCLEIEILSFNVNGNCTLKVRVTNKSDQNLQNIILNFEVVGKRKNFVKQLKLQEIKAKDSHTYQARFAKYYDFSSYRSIQLVSYSFPLPSSWIEDHYRKVIVKNENNEPYLECRLFNDTANSLETKYYVKEEIFKESGKEEDEPIAGAMVVHGSLTVNHENKDELECTFLFKNYFYKEIEDLMLETAYLDYKGNIIKCEWIKCITVLEPYTEYTISLNCEKTSQEKFKKIVSAAVLSYTYRVDDIEYKVEGNGTGLFPVKILRKKNISEKKDLSARSSVPNNNPVSIVTYKKDNKKIRSRNNSILVNKDVNKVIRNYYNNENESDDYLDNLFENDQDRLNYSDCKLGSYKDEIKSQIENAPEFLKKLVVVSGICKHDYENHKTVERYVNLAYFDYQFRLKTVKISVHYCVDCDCYFEYERSLRRQLNMNGIYYNSLYTKLVDEYGYNYKFDINLNEESILHHYGYHVGENGLFKDQRQMILYKLISAHLITASKAKSYLNFFIRFNGSKSGMEWAVSDWEEDIDFLNDLIAKQRANKDSHITLTL